MLTTLLLAYEHGCRCGTGMTRIPAQIAEFPLVRRRVARRRWVPRRTRQLIDVLSPLRHRNRAGNRGMNLPVLAVRSIWATVLASVDRVSPSAFVPENCYVCGEEDLLSWRLTDPNLGKLPLPLWTQLFLVRGFLSSLTSEIPLLKRKFSMELLRSCLVMPLVVRLK